MSRWCYRDEQGLACYPNAANAVIASCAFVGSLLAFLLVMLLKGGVVWYCVVSFYVGASTSAFILTFWILYRPRPDRVVPQPWHTLLLSAKKNLPGRTCTSSFRVTTKYVTRYTTGSFRMFDRNDLNLNHRPLNQRSNVMYLLNVPYILGFDLSHARRLWQQKSRCFAFW